ncbi:response regulator [Acidicapsa dinghuensis]|uniref:Response regulator n=1 Tax=Acidicapsa dinghuensis TaxID=2218256 RepID=A0ABW1EAR5_9BACT|nr:response regulator [Acidicapsa dinghuensis]
MRPKRRILLISSSEEWLSGLRFVLETRGFRVYAELCCDRLRELEFPQADVALVDCDSKQLDGWKFGARVKAAYPELPVLLVSEKGMGEKRTHAADGFHGAGHSSLELLERIRVMTSRRRGPRKMPVASVETVCA